MANAGDHDEDLLLVERAVAAPEGDTRAFEALVERHTGRVVANCRLITRSPGDAEDLAQDVFLKAYFALRRFERRASFRTWLHRIKVNHCLNHVKRRQGVVLEEIDPVDDAPPNPLRSEPTAEDNLHADDERERIVRVLDSMAPTLRIPLILRDMDEMSYQEVADMLGIGLSAVKMRIKRAREEFRIRYESRNEATP